MTRDGKKLILGLICIAVCWSALAFVLSACALPFKQIAVGSYQSTQILFDGVDDGSRILCFGSTQLPPPTPATGWHCTAGTPGLSDILYNKLAAKLVTAFDTQIRLGPVLKSEKQADTFDRVDLADLATLSGEIKDIADALPVSQGVQTWADTVHKWVAAVADAKKTLGGGK